MTMAIQQLNHYYHEHMSAAHEEDFDETAVAYRALLDNLYSRVAAGNTWMVSHIDDDVRAVVRPGFGSEAIQQHMGTAPTY